MFKRNILYFCALYLFSLSANNAHARPPELGLRAPTPNASQFDQIIAFGDSLTDVGNVAGVTEPGVSPVINGYYQETHFSDNIIWIEYIADYLGLPAITPGRGSSTTLPPLTGGNDWAWGGSEAAAGSVQPEGVTEPIPNLLTEVEDYLQSNLPSPDTLFAVWSGADNLLIGGDFTPKAAVSAVDAVITAISELNAAGARNFLVFNMPVLGATPSAQSGGIVSEVAANIYAVSYNIALKQALRDLFLDPCFEGNIFFVNIFKEMSVILEVVRNGGTYTPNFFVPGPPVAIDNVTDEALNVFNQTGTFPTNYLFWDGVHPTTQGHQVVAGVVLKALNRGNLSLFKHHKCEVHE